ncbi:MAG: Deoxyribonuclease, TatD family [Candidatus Amesbacteria bacterium GW2011_GWA2_42_12]|uniref:Deoxyribonuclease, TatD family n=1 Tax=Candidatus Amesbacteria bacterium GW2011_GWA2_42_12 TaxID=1618356 RepID=A0A0G1AGI7_9BACT|nr:MAG: Deoxyribonuclease, TatD family [Candidatus Amesbacteria bacterium GW2011_GWA2_42_12]
MIDAHCHLQKFENPGEVISGLEAVICCGADLESSKKAIEISDKFPNVWATVGIHPEENFKSTSSRFASKILRSKEILKSKLLKLLRQPRVVAVGECGLDFLPETREEEKSAQRELFKFNIDLAKEIKLPLVVHCRNAFEDVFSILNAQDSMLKVQMHCFTGNMEQMLECVRRGLYISFGGILTFKSSQELREVARLVPEDKLLIETDSPYLAPEPIRGTRNEPKNVKIVAEVLAKTRGVDFNAIDQLTSQNARKFFNL